MRILVTGGEGFIGRPVVRHLRADGHDVTVADLAPSEFADYAVDVLDFEAVASSVRDADIVVHLAGPVLETARRDPYLASRVQFLGTLNVLEACVRESINKVVLASSFYVYDGIPANDIVNENSPLNANKMELFGAVKLMAEQLVLAYHAKHGLKYVILRFGSAYGSGVGSNLIRTFLEAGFDRRVLDVWGQGKRVNQYTYTEDIAQGSVLALDAEDEIFNLISPEETSTGELAQLFSERHGFESRFVTEKPEGASVPYMSSRKAIRQLGWKPTPLADALEELVSAYAESQQVT